MKDSMEHTSDYNKDIITCLIYSMHMIVLLSIGAVSLIRIISAATTYHLFGIGVIVAQGPGQQ